MSPFTSRNALQFTDVLSKLEMDVFGVYGPTHRRSGIPKSLSSIAIDESALQVTAHLADIMTVILTVFSFDSRLG